MPAFLKFAASVPSLPQRGLLALVRVYRLFLSPWLGSACRFEPTCSAYALTALEQHGAAAGSYLAICRVARCHPLCESGHDPVPDLAPRWFRRVSRPSSPDRSIDHPHVVAPRASGDTSSTSLNQTSP